MKTGALQDGRVAICLGKGVGTIEQVLKSERGTYTAQISTLSLGALSCVLSSATPKLWLLLSGSKNSYWVKNRIGNLSFPDEIVISEPKRLEISANSVQPLGL